MKSGASVTQWAANNGDNQLWRITPASNGAFTLTARHSDQQLALSDAAQAALSQQIEAVGAVQEWTILPVNP